MEAFYERCVVLVAPSPYHTLMHWLHMLPRVAAGETRQSRTSMCERIRVSVLAWPPSCMNLRQWTSTHIIIGRVLAAKADCAGTAVHFCPASCDGCTSCPQQEKVQWKGEELGWVTHSCLANGLWPSSTGRMRYTMYYIKSEVSSCNLETSAAAGGQMAGIRQSGPCQAAAAGELVSEVLAA